MTWRDSAACLGLAPDLFFPEKAAESSSQAQAAKAVCADCPVRLECAEDAVETRAGFGVWGGLSPKERRQWARARRRDPDAPLPPIVVKEPAETVFRQIRVAQHGTRAKYVAGCRCDLCREAQRFYDRQRANKRSA